MRRLSQGIAYSVGFLTVVGAGWLLWRRQKSNLPCPTSLSFLLENPFMERVAGAEMLLDRAGVAPGMRVLDAGCGPGRITLPAARRVGPTGEVVALDIQAAMLDRLRAKLAAQNVANVRIVHAGLGQGHIEATAFDRAFLVTVLGEIPDKAAALREIYDSLKPGGLLSITELLPDPDFQTPDTVRRLAHGAGFMEEKIMGGFPAYTMNWVKPG
jgi:ubiquinone/menaquinone biosynthesis C-methylase UbiE